MLLPTQETPSVANVGVQPAESKVIH
uniref:Uncharacterized protein n=1 Tax=Anguilla anguilla TaxID=7936 RepID=A0A0E9Q039_ANGAN